MPKALEEWYKTAFGEDYLRIYAHRNLEEADSDVSGVLRQVSLDASSRVLDLACGSGRHLHHLLARFQLSFGSDLSLPLLHRAKEQLPAEFQHLLQSDMRNIPFRDCCFDAVFSFFTSFGYFERESEDFKVLLEIHRVLKGGAIFVMDYANASYALRNLNPLSSRQFEDLRIREVRSYDKISKRLIKKVDVETPLEKRHYTESLRLYQPEELRSLFKKAGFKIQAELGAFGDEQFSNASRRFIVLAEKIN